MEQTVALGNLFVGDLSVDVTEKEIFNLFMSYGKIEKIVLIKKKEKNLAYAFLTYSNIQSCYSARSELNGVKLKNKHILVLIYNKQLPKIENANIYIKNIPLSFLAKDLDNCFKKIGTILSSKICHDINGQSLGYGFIQFSSSEEADKAVKETKLLQGNKFIVEKFIPKNERFIASGNNIYVRGFDEAFTEDALEHIFQTYGKISSKIISRDNVGVSRRFGFVCFEDRKSAEDAVKDLHGKTSEFGFEWFVCLALKKIERGIINDKKLNDLKEIWKKRNLCIKGIPDVLNDNQLRDIFKDYGEIDSLKIATIDNYKFGSTLEIEKKPTGTVFVCYRDQKAAERAFSSLQHLKINGADLKVFK